MQVEWSKDQEGKMIMHEVPGSNFVIEAELVFLSMGFLHVEHAEFLTELGIEFDDRGNIKANQEHQANGKGIFVAGDAASGASLVVRAIAQGKSAALSVDRYLHNYPFTLNNHLETGK